MFEMNKALIGIAAGVTGMLFIGYCLYFDNKRRNDPEYKKKVRERRQRNRKAEAANKSSFPDLNDHVELEKYFLNEIQLSEKLIARGEHKDAVEHLYNALVVCGQPTRLLHMLQTSVPNQVFVMLIQKVQDMRVSSEGNNMDNPTLLSLHEAESGTSGLIHNDVE